MSISSPPNMPGWTLIQAPVRSGNGTHLPAVTISAMSQHGRYRPCILVVFDPRAFGLEKPPAWLQLGSKVWALRGRGDFARTLRIMPNGPFPLTKTPRGGNFRLTIPALDGHPPKGAPRTEVEFDFSDGWFDIVLPDWHGPKPPVVQPAVSAAAPAAPARPFTLAAGAHSHPNWASDAGRAAHARAVKGGAA